VNADSSQTSAKWITELTRPAEGVLGEPALRAAGVFCWRVSPRTLWLL